MNDTSKIVVGVETPEGFEALTVGGLKALLSGALPVVPEPPASNRPWEAMRHPRLVAPQEVHIAPGSAKAYIVIETADELDVTCRVNVDVVNLPGHGINVGSWSDRQQYIATKELVWRPGDDRRHLVVIDMPSWPREDGNGLRVRLKRTNMDDDTHTDIRVIYQDGAVNEPPAIPFFHRTPYTIDLSGAQPAAELIPSEARWSDSGYIDDEPVWRSRLPHGYTQPNGGEVGLYMSEEKWPVEAITPISYDAAKDAIRLSSAKLTQTAQIENELYDYQAVMINAQRMPEWAGEYCVWTAKLTTPDRRGSWPAFWTIGWNADTSHAWPPENDILEHFNWGGWPTGNKQTTNGQHAGVRGSNDREWADTYYAPLEVDVTAGPHEYTTLQTPDFIYWFFDGVETNCQRNVLQGKVFPMLNVAVKNVPGDGSYADGSGDMLVHHAARYESGWVVS